MRRSLIALILLTVGCATRAPVGYSTPTALRSPAGDCRRFHGPYYCYGAVDARHELISMLRSEPERGVITSIERVGRLNIREAIPRLHELLAPGVDERVRVQAALALVELGDVESSALVELLRAFDQGARFQVSWPSLAEALASLDGPTAYRYALEWMASHPTLEIVRDHVRATWVVEVCRDHGDAQALPTLSSWAAQMEQIPFASLSDPREVRARSNTADSLGSRILGARIALDEQPLRDRMIRILGTPGAVVPSKPHLVIEGLGRHADEIDALGRFASITDPEASIAYHGMDRLAPQLDERQRAHAIERLLRFSHVRDDPSHDNYAGSTQARHHASLVRLGHAASAETLVRLAARADGTTGSLVAAYEALALGLPGAEDASVDALAAARRPPTNNYEERVALVDIAARTMGARDPRWALALLDTNVHVHDRTLHHFVRIRPGAAACDALFERIPGSAERSVRPALLALTAIGNVCRPHLEQLEAHPSAPDAVRSYARQVLAMLP